MCYMVMLHLVQDVEINMGVYLRRLPKTITCEASIYLVWEMGDNTENHSSISLMDCRRTADR